MALTAPLRDTAVHLSAIDFPLNPMALEVLRYMMITYHNLVLAMESTLAQAQIVATSHVEGHTGRYCNGCHSTYCKRPDTRYYCLVCCLILTSVMSL